MQIIKEQKEKVKKESNYSSHDVNGLFARKEINFVDKNKEND